MHQRPQRGDNRQRYQELVDQVHVGSRNEKAASEGGVWVVGQQRIVPHGQLGSRSQYGSGE
jgi:hypothetical protein